MCTVPNTSSPTWSPVTPSPSSSTVPANSRPMPEGNVTLWREVPWRIL